MTDGNATQQQGRRRIIERPRLTRLLDESPARIKMLVAPAGYGKTTLARQWLARSHRRVAWIQCSPAASDVAVLLAHIAEAAAGLVGDERSRTVERLRATAEPALELSLLVDLIVSDLEAWPEDAWLALDDYQALMVSSDAEEVISGLLTRTRLNALITSRRRPTWATPRQIFYGEIVAIGARTLAMDEVETRELMGQKPERLADLVAAADGWPAFIALAAASESIDVSSVDLRENLYEFLANEIYFSVDEDVQRALREVALAPGRHTLLLKRLHPHEVALRIRDEAVRVGILSDAGGGEVELHPLLQQFLLKRALDGSKEALGEALGRVWRVLTDDQSWDDAFAVLAAVHAPQLLPELFDRALDQLLETGRTVSLRRWIDFAVANDVDAPIVKLAEAELALRAGTLTRAEAIASEAADEFIDSPDRAAKSWCIAGQAAHLHSEEETAIQYYRRAALTADSDEVRQVARWGELAASIDLELASVESVMRDVVAHESSDPAGIVRRSNVQLIYELRFGGFQSLRDAALAKQVIDHVKDPVRRAGFWSVYATALAVTARYEEALDAVTEFSADARQYRVDFAMPYAHAARAMAMLGLRRYDEVNLAITETVLAARNVSDDHALANADAIRARLMLSQGRFEEALATLEAMPSRRVTRGMVGELLACRALALACLEDASYSTFATEAQRKTRVLEAQALAPIAHAVYKSKTNAKDFARATRLALDTATQLGSWDCFVCGYRAHPEFLLPLRGDKPRHAALLQVVNRVGDSEILWSIGLDSPGRGEGLLSPRESEIHSLIALGLTNREIADRLVISESTVKLHVHRVLEKLGVRTRTAAAARYRVKQERDRS